MLLLSTVLFGCHCSCYPLLFIVPRIFVCTFFFPEGHCSSQWPFCSWWYNSERQLRSRYDVVWCHPLQVQLQLLEILLKWTVFTVSVWRLCVLCTQRQFILSVSDPFAAVFGNESFGGGFADFSALAKVPDLFIFIIHIDRVTDIIWIYKMILKNCTASRKIYQCS